MQTVFVCSVHPPFGALGLLEASTKTTQTRPVAHHGGKRSRADDDGLRGPSVGSVLVETAGSWEVIDDIPSGKLT